MSATSLLQHTGPMAWHHPTRQALTPTVHLTTTPLHDTYLLTYFPPSPLPNHTPTPSSLLTHPPTLFNSHQSLLPTHPLFPNPSYTWALQAACGATLPTPQHIPLVGICFRDIMQLPWLVSPQAKCYQKERSAQGRYTTGRVHPKDSVTLRWVTLQGGCHS